MDMRTVPKHGKKLENRLWSKDHRGDGKRPTRDGGINPDGAIEVAAVCGSEVRVFASVKQGRALLSVRTFAHRGAALLWAHEHDQRERGQA